MGELEAISQSKRNSTPDKRQISVRWLIGSILAGVTSLVLMGGALFAALDGRQYLSTPAILFTFENAGSQLNGNSQIATKGDRLGLAGDTEERPSNVLMVSTVKRENDRDVVKVRPFMIINAPLAIAPKTKYSYPKFNPLAVFSESGKPEPVSLSSDTIYGADVESEVSIKISPFPYRSRQITLSSRQRTVEIEELVRRTGPGLEGNTTSITALSNIDPTRFSTTANEQFITPGVTITAENVSVVAMINQADYKGIHYQDRIIRVRKNSPLSEILIAEGMDEAEAGLLQKVLSSDLGDTGVIRGDRIRLAYQLNQQSVSITRISLYRGASHIVSVARSDANQFVYSREPNRPPQLALGEKRQAIVTKSRLLSVYDGINRAARSEGLTPELTKTMVRIFAFDVDFRHKITPSDEISAFVSLEDGQTTPNENSEILFASIKLNSVTRNYYRFRDKKTGRVDFYDKNGKSAKKFLLRKPVPNGRFRSPFGFRIHPISRVRKMHWGTDWSAPRGTPIIAAGNGLIQKAGWAGGYGRQIILVHTNGYKTFYNHQTRFAKGIKPGKRVRQGQIIGYVGTTGYSTGPHLHYEVSVNGNKVDPMRIRLPKGRILKGQELELFEAERDRIDALLLKHREDSTRIALN